MRSPFRLFSCLSVLFAAGLNAQPSESYVSQDNLQLWLKADSLGLTDGTAVAAWSDSSGNANNAVQATIANQPVYVASVATLNNKPAVRFDAIAKKYLTVADTPGLMPTEGFTVIAVASRATGTSVPTSAMMIAEKGITGDTNSGYSLRFQSTVLAGSYIHANGATSAITTGATYAAAPYYVLGGIYNRVENRLFINGGLADSSAATSAIAPRATALSVGGRLAASTLAPANNLHGDIAELLVYGRAISDAERRDLEAYLYAKYGVGTAPLASLPVFSVRTGTYAETQVVSIACSDMTDAVIRYTIDGSNPTDSSPVYSAALTVATNTTIKARAFKAGYTQPAEAAVSVITLDVEVANIPRQGLQTWLRADSLALGDEAAISVWPDQSGNKNDAIAGTGAPTFEASGPNGKPTVEFSSGQYFSIPHSESVQAKQMSAFAVVKRTTGSAVAIIVEKYASSANDGYGLQMPNVSSVKYYIDTTSVTSPITGTTPRYVLAAGLFDQVGLNLYVDGVGPVSAARTAEIPATTTPVYIGGRAATSPFVGEIAEIILYNRGLSSAERVDVEAYLYAKYAIGTQPSLAVPVFNLQGGVYGSAQEVRISGPAGAQLFYKIGSAPTWTPYSGAITVTETTVVTAKATKLHYLDSQASMTVQVDSAVSSIPRQDLQLWLKADSLSQTLDSPVSFWPDLSGKGNHARQDTPVRQPKFKPDGVSTGKPAVAFTASELDHLIVDNVPGLNPSALTIFAVAKRTSATAVRDAILVKGSDTSGYGLLYGDTSANIHSTINANNVATPVDMAAYNILCMTFDGSVQTLAYQGDSVEAENVILTDEYATPPAINASDLTIGGQGASKALEGAIAEVMVFSRALSLREIKQLQSYAHAKYGIGSLPSATPPVFSVQDKVLTEVEEIKITAGVGSTIYYTKDPAHADWSGSGPVPAGWLSAVPEAGPNNSPPVAPTSVSVSLNALVEGYSATNLRAYSVDSGYAPSKQVQTAVIVDQTILDLPRDRLRIWVRSDALSLAHDAKVSHWPNVVSGPDLQLKQSDPAERPTFKKGASGAMSSVSFNGTFLTTGAPIYTEETTVFAVVKTNGGTWPQMIMRNFPATHGTQWVGFEMHYTSSTAWIGINREDNPYNPIVPSPAPEHISENMARSLTRKYFGYSGHGSGNYTVVSGGFKAMYVRRVSNGVQSTGPIDCTYDEANHPLSNFILGGSLNGHVLEVLVYDRLLTGADNSAVNAYLANRYRNLIGGLAQAKTKVPVFTPPGGVVAAGDKISISAEPRAVIKYVKTVDDGPAGAEATYSAPIVIDENVETLKIMAYAKKPGYADSDPVEMKFDVKEPDGVLEQAMSKVSRTGLRLWFRADSLALDEGDGVAFWQDQSGKANHAAQSIIGQQPTYVAEASDINNKPSIRFGVGGHKSLVIPDSSSLDVKQLSIVAVMKRISGAGTAVVYTRSNATDGYDMLSLGAASIHVGINSSNLSGAIPTARQGFYNIVIGSYDQSFMRFYLNGSLITETAATNEIRAHSKDVAIGATGSVNPLHGEIAELLVYDHALGDEERQALHEYLRFKYGIGPQSTLKKPEFRLLDDKPFADGTYSTSQTIKIFSPDGKPIRYTVDGSTPTSTSALYASPIALSASQTIKAISCASGFADSPVAVLRFAFNGVSGLPTDNGAPSGYQTDTDGDGVPNAIETAIGSDPNSAADSGAGTSRIYQYDAIHQLTNDGVKTYNYDAEGNVSRN